MFHKHIKRERDNQFFFSFVGFSKRKIFSSQRKSGKFLLENNTSKLKEQIFSFTVNKTKMQAKG